MRYLITDVNSHDVFTREGYYLDSQTAVLHQVMRFLQYPIMVKINGMHANVFYMADNAWWIGAKYYHEVDKFPLIGPYADIEIAIVFFRLHGDIIRPTFD